MNRPRIGITLGDPAGIGPEIFLKAWDKIHHRCDPIVYGPYWGLQVAAAASGCEMPNELTVVDTGLGKPSDFDFGRVSARCGEHAIAAVEQAARDALAGELNAIMTCPLNKESIHAAGSLDIGHQEILGRLAKSDSTATMLMAPNLRVVHLSTHRSLADAVRFISKETVLERIKLTNDAFKGWGLDSPRIAVSAVNPHGGDGGLIGREEIDEIQPAVNDAEQLGIDATGPLPADSVFTRTIDGEFDVVLAMYHDQGHIAIKVHDFHGSVSATLGLPFTRTSVDHGTAFDIAGRGVANESGAVAAIDAAITLSTRQLRRETSSR